MLFSVLLMLVCGTQAGFYGFVRTYTTKDFDGHGYPGTKRTKVSFSSCQEVDSLFCGGDCSNNGAIHKTGESVGEWCQKEIPWSWTIVNLTTSSEWWPGTTSWIFNLNGVSTWKAAYFYDYRNRSDIGKLNSSPQTNTLPTVRVPLNCQRNINLLNFDPDGDEVRCRYAVSTSSSLECYNCTPPSILRVSSSCTLSFSPTNSSNKGPYAVQLMLEDFPRQNITLTDSGGAQVVKTPSDFISTVPLQFVLQVLPAVPSCSEGLYLPRFLPPTPGNRAQIYAAVSQLLGIPIRAEATQSVITELLFSGPYNVVKSTSGSGNFTLTWTPSNSQNNESHPICFVIQANYSGSVYQSEHRCVIVTVGPLLPPRYHVFHLKMKISTTLSLVNKGIIEKAIKDELVRRGMLPGISVRLLGGDLVEVRSPAPPGG